MKVNLLSTIIEHFVLEALPTIPYCKLVNFINKNPHNNIFKLKINKTGLFIVSLTYWPLVILCLSKSFRFV